MILAVGWAATVVVVVIIAAVVAFVLTKGLRRARR
jgi:hypothetical protein